MQPIASIHAVGQAGALIQHWDNHDLPGVVQCIAQMSTVECLQDVVAALLIMRNMTGADLDRIVIRAQFEEVVGEA